MDNALGILNGRYRLDHLIGQGGFARVYLATDLRLRRQVAVKILSTALANSADGPEFLARFEREAQAVAGLDHPNILGIYDSGEVGTVVYLVMPYIAGVDLSDQLRRMGRLSLDQVTVYVGQIAAALDYAHAQNIIHRDIKPQNMLLRAQDNRLLLADFGVAKMIGSGASNLRQTATVGTLAYMAPEQFRGQPVLATDIYALGCMLFQMLTGTVPYTGTTEQIIYSHIHEPVPRLAAFGLGQAEVALQPIVDRAMAKRPEDRFRSAGDVAWAIQTIAANTATRDVPPSADTPTVPASSASTAITPPVLPALTPKPVSVLSSSVETAIDSPTVVATATRRRTWTLGLAVSLLAALIISACMWIAVERQRATTPTTVASGGGPTATVAPAATSTPAPSTAAPTVAAAPTTPATTFQSMPVATLNEHTGPVGTLAWSPNGTILASAAYADDNVVRLWAPDGRSLARLTGHTGPIATIAWSPDGTKLATGAGDGTVRLWNASGTFLFKVGDKTASFLSVSWSQQGNILAVGGEDGYVQIWDANGKFIGRTDTAHTGGVTALTWSLNGQVLASGSRFGDPLIHLWNRDGTKLNTLNDHFGSIQGLAWSPDGQTLASGSDDAKVRLWTATGTPIKELSGHTGKVLGVTWSLSGTTLASFGEDNTIHLWSQKGTEIAILREHSGAVRSVAWSSSGALLASGADDGTVRLWTPAGAAAGVIKAHNTRIWSVAWSPVGALLASASDDKSVRLWR